MKSAFREHLAKHAPEVPEERRSDVERLIRNEPYISAHAQEECESIIQRMLAYCRDDLDGDALHETLYVSRLMNLLMRNYIELMTCLENGTTTPTMEQRIDTATHFTGDLLRAMRECGDRDRPGVSP